MRQLIYDKNTCDGWKSYPIHIILDRVSKCCQTWLVLVQSMSGGFVTANCFKCGQKETIIEYEFKKLPHVCCCPECKKVMKAELVDKNYCYICQECDLYVRLADLLPNYNDL